eukprot:11997938-Alexandrium_andersonii.AAC.1
MQGVGGGSRLPSWQRYHAGMLGGNDLLKCSMCRLFVVEGLACRSISSQRRVLIARDSRLSRTVIGRIGQWGDEGIDTIRLPRPPIRCSAATCGQPLLSHRDCM